MKIDINDIAYWMDAIRDEENHQRYHMLESFWHGQLKSKVWLCEELPKVTHATTNKIVIFGGWYGVLSTMLFNSELGVRHITSVDIDPKCEEIAVKMNKKYEMAEPSTFKAVTADMCDYEYTEHPQIIINLSCEHITQKQYEAWLEKIDPDTWIVVQSNNFASHKEHINCSDSLDDFKWKSKISKPFYTGTLELPKYDRYMIIGRK
jgi:trans-aconitate methyltransferase